MGHRRQLLCSIRHYFIALLVISLTTALCLCDTINLKGKRQIFREQVLPFKGGKIPESALRSDRLNLNQLQKEGFSLPDGVVLSNRRHLRHPFPYHQEPELLKVYMTDDGRYVSVYGKYTTDIPDTIDTTYLIRSPIQLNQALSNNISEFPRQRVFKPSLLSLIIPNTAIYGKSLQRQDEINSQHNNQVNNQNVPYKQRTKSNYYYHLRGGDSGSYQNNRLSHASDSSQVQNQKGFQDRGWNKPFPSKDECAGCVQKTGYSSPKSRVWISRTYPSQKQEWSY